MVNLQLLLFLSMFDYWLRVSKSLNSLEMEPTYCTLHLVEVAKKIAVWNKIVFVEWDIDDQLLK